MGGFPAILYHKPLSYGQNKLCTNFTLRFLKSQEGNSNIFWSINMKRDKNIRCILVLSSNVKSKCLHGDVSCHYSSVEIRTKAFLNTSDNVRRPVFMWDEFLSPCNNNSWDQNTWNNFLSKPLQTQISGSCSFRHGFRIIRLEGCEPESLQQTVDTIKPTKRRYEDIYIKISEVPSASPLLMIRYAQAAVAKSSDCGSFQSHWVQALRGRGKMK